MKKQTHKRKFKFVVLAVDVALFTVIDEKLHVLLMRMQKKPFEGFWAMPGGLMKPDEEPNVAAKRILKEKVGITTAYLEQLYTFGRVGRDPFGRVVSVGYTALLPSAVVSRGRTGKDGDVRWFPVAKVPSLAYDHDEILETGLSRLRAKLAYTNIVKNLLSKEFTLTELQRMYEVVLGRKLDKRNFRKKLFARALLKKTGKRRRGVSNRPAELFSFKEKGLSIVEVL